MSWTSSRYFFHPAVNGKKLSQTVAALQDATVVFTVASVIDEATVFQQGAAKSCPMAVKGTGDGVCVQGADLDTATNFVRCCYDKKATSASCPASWTQGADPPVQRVCLCACPHKGGQLPPVQHALIMTSKNAGRW